VQLALTDLDNGLFLEKTGKWTSDCHLSQTFVDSESVAKAAAENKVKNAAVAIVHGEPPRAVGFL